jgi:hypothetical protein
MSSYASISSLSAGDATTVLLPVLRIVLLGWFFVVDVTAEVLRIFPPGNP